MGAVQGIERGTRVACNGCRWESHTPKHPNSTRNLASGTTLLERLYITRCWCPISRRLPAASSRQQLVTVPLTRSLEAQNTGRQLRAVAVLARPLPVLSVLPRAVHSEPSPPACVVRDTSTHMAAGTQAAAGLAGLPSALSGGTSTLNASKTDRTLGAKGAGCIASASSCHTAARRSTMRASARYGALL
jgi:hypothetical protein